jgi:transposase
MTGRNNNYYGTHDRIRVLRLRSQGRSYRQIQHQTDISKSTVARWVSNAQNLFRQPVKHTPKSTRQLMIEKNIVEILDRTSDTRFVDLTYHVNKALQRAGISKKISKTSVFRTLHGKDLKFTYKLKTFVKDSEIISERAIEFKKAMKGVCPTQVISIDETAIWYCMQRKKGFSRRGKRCVSKIKPAVSRIKLSLLLAVTTDGILDHHIQWGSIKQDVFNSFIERIGTAGRTHILIDNASIHKSKELVEIVKRKKQKLVFLPPYSPQFQPIENTFSWLKSAYRNCDPDFDNKNIHEDMLVRLTTSMEYINDPAYFKETFRKCWTEIENIRENT